MKMKKIVFPLMAATLLASCGTVRDDNVDVEGKSVLLVATYDGGLGSNWLSELGKRFADKYKDVSFEDGKTGVVVRVLPNRAYNGSDLYNGALQQDVYFTEDVSYFDHVNKGNFLDISDIVTEKLTDFGETKSIEDKLSSDMKEYLTAKDGKYYAIPFYDGLYGLIYDYDLFEEQNYFFSPSGTFVDSKTAKKSAGPNGKEGDYDDGLPSTYEQFYKLIDAIEGDGKNAFSYSSSLNNGLPYVSRALTSYWSDFEGYANTRAAYSLSGTIPLVTSIENGVATTENTAINDDNGYLVQKQEGKLKALQFMKKITSHMDSTAGTVDEAQSNFITNYSLHSDQYAMLFDGAWWENEATDTFNTVQGMYGTGKADKRYGFMSIPKADASKIGEKQTLVSQNNSYCFISSKTKLPKLAKLFFQFAHTDSNLSAFTAELSLTRALSYELTDSDKEKATFYANNLIDVKNDSNIFTPVSSNSVVINNSSTFNIETWAWGTTVNGTDQTNPYVAFSSSSGLTPEEYFNGMSASAKTKWATLKK